MAYGLREQFWNTMNEPEILARVEQSLGLIASIKHALKPTSVVVTHDMGTAFSVSDRLIMIGRGRGLLVSPKEEFRTTPDRAVRDFVEGRAPASEDVASLLASS